MSMPGNEDEILDLEASSLVELDRPAAIPNEPHSPSDAEPITLKDPAPHQRCDSAHREILKTNFPSNP